MERAKIVTMFCVLAHKISAEAFLSIMSLPSATSLSQTDAPRQRHKTRVGAIAIPERFDFEPGDAEIAIFGCPLQPRERLVLLAQPRVEQRQIVLQGISALFLLQSLGDFSSPVTFQSTRGKGRPYPRDLIRP